MISISAYSQELESLKQFTGKKPLFISDKDDTEFVASRCSALYLVLGSRANEAFNQKDPQGIAAEYLDKAVIYDKAREILLKAKDNLKEPAKNQQKDFAKTYGDLTLSNWKKNGDLFKGLVNEVLTIVSKRLNINNLKVYLYKSY